MPRSKRDNIKLKHDQISNHIEKAIVQTGQLFTMFSEPHPDYAQGYENIIIILTTALEFITKMKEFI